MTARPERAAGTPEPSDVPKGSTEEPSKLSDRRTRAAKRAVVPDPANQGFTIITGLSGAGRSEAAHCLEDLGYFVVDNLPPALLPKMAELTTRPGGPARVAIVVDARGGVFFSELSKALEELKKLHADYRIVFLEASDDDLVNRYEATRRRHPLAPADRVVEGIRKERHILGERAGAQAERLQALTVSLG